MSNARANSVVFGWAAIAFVVIGVALAFARLGIGPSLVGLGFGLGIAALYYRRKVSKDANATTADPA
jgi:hypothetical protein